jgi:ribosome biogenesis GTPase
MTLEDWGWSSDFARFLADGEQAGRVLAVSHGLCRVGTPAGECDAAMSGRVAASTVKPVAGDWVACEGPRVARVLPRRSQLSRKAPGTRVEMQVLAANVDVCFLVCGLDGDLNLRRLDRYLLMTKRAGIEPVVVLNKTDLASDLPGVMTAVRNAAPGVPSVAVSAAHGDPGAVLGPWLIRGRTVALLGSSGVGKSTLVNCLLGWQRQRTKRLRARDQRGQHTTTRRELIPLPCGALLLDTPGLRELQPWLPGDALEETFADLAALAEGCRFRDCRHQGEPGCAVAQAVEDGELSDERVAHYARLQREARYLERLVDQGAAAAEKRRWKAIHRAFRRTGKERN